ncbi:MAG: WYL domain-containing protein [Prevotella sp.]|jgi:predicted DNA-binding transcriptional regulator YafY|nr:WYL domain-containing protein [Prevotella sp.]
MATNKNAIIRYYALDRCFKNTGRRHYIEDLIEACNDAIFQYTGKEEGVHRHQVYNDINFMEEQWDIPLERLKDGRRTYFRYSDPSFTIHDTLLSEEDIVKVESAFSLLRCFEGLPNFEWVAEIDAHFRTMFRLSHSRRDSVVGFEHNPYIRGLSFFPQVFNAIVNERALRIEYHRFDQPPRTFIVHPYYLKQYSSRWYLLSLNDERKCVFILALDRFLSLSEADIPYIKDPGLNIDDYFFDAIGITIPPEKKVETVHLRIASEQMPYVTTKPIHGSQRIIEQGDDYAIVEIKVYNTYELKSIILSFGSKVEVLSPDSLRQEIADIVSRMNGKYQK